MSSNLADSQFYGRFSLHRAAAPAAVALLLALITSLGGCGCGFECNDNGNNRDPASFTLGFSDETAEEVKQVVIEVDSISFRRSNAADVVVDTFTISELALVDAASFQMDLLNYGGRNQLLVIENLELEAATYSSVLVTLLDGDVNLSYVQESDDTLKQLQQPQGGLSLPGFTLSSGEQDYTVEFGLAQSLQFQPGSDDYLLSTDGIRVENSSTAASLSGRVAASLFDSVSPCDAKTDPEAGNRIYLYQGTGLTDVQLADVFTTASSSTVPGNAQAPFAVATLFEETTTGSWQYVFGYLPAGAYTLAFSCDAAGDDPVDFDDISVPLADTQSYEVDLVEGTADTCDLDEAASCS
ncbi:MAG: DUF4382 domain-containing protein [Gammaproteobacteria bacterium]|nr:DUF4382 domain-containing protein [Gammaproteobacteria bacterium]